MDAEVRLAEAYLGVFNVPARLEGCACLDMSGPIPGLQAVLTARGASATTLALPPAPDTLGSPDPIVEAIRASGGPFDYIFLGLDAFFERDLRRLVSALRDQLKPEGILAVDSTVTGSLFERRWSGLVRNGGFVATPTFREVIEGVLADFAVRDVGRIARGVRDEPAFAFHCTLLKPLVLLMGGASGAGKTIFARQFSRLGANVINLDFVYSELYYRGSEVADEGYKAFRKSFDPNRIGTSIDNLVKNGMVDHLVDLTLPFFKAHNVLTVAEGYQFGIDEVVENTCRKLHARGFRVEHLVVGGRPTPAPPTEAPPST